MRLHLVTPNPPPRAGETEASPGASPPGPADWEDPLLRALPREARVPLVWGSSGGSGASPPLPDSSLTSRQIQAENLRAAASRLADVDQAAGMTALTRDYIVAQAAVGMLAQANSLPRLALSLVGA
ncbi:MAG: hypothetical protein KQJ78_10010 [Deltaproteobacteria bacterium]|nr:hypothetical protein [Deltaproteobacteria bacterium]